MIIMNNKKTKKLNWWKKFWGKMFFITLVDDGLRNDEILVKGHRIYISKDAIKELIKEV